MTATFTEEQEQEPEDLGIWPPESAQPRLGRAWQRVKDGTTPEGVITAAVVTLCAAGVFWMLQPAEIFNASTTPAGGDMGAHVWLPDFLKRDLLPHGQFTGWAPDWYDGFPALTYYFPLPMWAIALVSYVIPYNVAFKLVTIAGLVTLPIAAWAFGRLARVPFPVPAVLAAATLPFLFSRDFTIYGGNIASTMAGEFSFSISLSLALVFLGLVARGLRTGRHVASAAVVLAVCGLCHILPLLFAVVGAGVLTVMSAVENRDWRRIVWGAIAVVTGGLLTAFWALPFQWRLPYATNMGYERDTHFVHDLFNHNDLLIGFAIAGFALSAVRVNRIGIFLGFMATASALAFRFEVGRLWNARMLPFWFLCLFLLAGLFFSELGCLIIDLVRSRPAGVVANYMAVPVLLFLGTAAFVLYPLNVPTGSSTDVFGLTPKHVNFVNEWAYWNYSGYQNQAKSRSAEYQALMAKMKQVGQQYGCGQAMWQYEPELNDMGTPDALMLLPYWTHGCIGSEEGLYYESSASTPFHFLNDAELSDSPPNPERGLDYPSAPNVTEGVQHLQMNGDRYFMAETPDIEKQADSNSNLQLVATVGPFAVNYTSGSTGVKERTWHIYKVLDSDLVAPLLNQPVVLTGVQSKDPDQWLKASQAWYLDPSRWGVYEAASGPAAWTRVPSTAATLPTSPLPPVQVSGISTTPESISFDVDQTGVPVLVRESYFPNWQVSGASGIYRVTPNLMVVVPTRNHVVLTYGVTAVDWVGRILSLLGLVAAVLVWRLGPIRFAPERPSRRRIFTLAYVGEGAPEKERQWWPGGQVADSAQPWPPYNLPGRMTPPDTEFLDRVFKAYDIRGTVPDQINVALAEAVGAAFARYCAAPRVLVARDMRPSGPDLVRAFAAGANSVGADVVDLGLCSTDELYFASGSLDAPGAMFTASHNPAQYNGMKLCRAGARPIGAETGLQEIKAAVAARLAGDAPAQAALPGRVATADVLGDYAAKVRSFVDLGSLRPLKVIADTANGMGGLVVPAVFEGLPFDLEILFQELDGTFPNHPADPIQPANLRDLQARIRETGAVVGLAFDGDADRCFLVDDRGEPLSGSTTTALVAAAMLEKHPGATILHNLICSKAVAEIIEERSGHPVRTRVGHSYIKAVMAETDALFGGEHSGHYYFRDNFRADSGAIAALVVLEVLSRDGRPLSEIRKDFERYADSGEINTEVDDPASVIEAVANHFSEQQPDARIDRLDGLTVDLGDWWFNLRPSNTEPLLRLNLEAPDRASCDLHTREILDLISVSSPEPNRRS